MAHEYQCSACAFMIRSENDDELVEFVQSHARDSHDLSMEAEEIREGWSAA